jgi:hypothetical protein
VGRSRNAVYFNEGSQFSNGCTFEYLAGLKAGVELFDHYRAPLKLAAVINLIAAAVESLESDGISVPKLREVLAELSSFSP